MPHYFRLSDCERLLPQIERALRDAISHKSEYQKADSELDAALHRIRTSGGLRVNPDAHLALRARRDTSAAAIKSAVEQIQQTGALVKDLDIGLIDFLTIYRGQEVCLCWKLGESGIQYWHGAEDGFRGRKLIDADFLWSHGTENAENPN